MKLSVLCGGAGSGLDVGRRAYGHDASAGNGYRFSDSVTRINGDDLGVDQEEIGRCADGVRGHDATVTATSNAARTSHLGMDPPGFVRLS